VLCYRLSVVIVLCCYLCCSVIIVLFYVLIVCTEHCHRVLTQLQLTNISIFIYLKLQFSIYAYWLTSHASLQLQSQQNYISATLITRYIKKRGKR